MRVLASLYECKRHMRRSGSTLKLIGIYRREPGGYVSPRCETYILHKAGDAIASMVIRQLNRRWRREKSAHTAGVSSKTRRCRGSINDQKNESVSWILKAIILTCLNVTCDCKRQLVLIS